MGRTHWKLVKRRDHQTLRNFILPHLESARSLVVSDAWRGYSGMGQFCRHFAVNHSKEFVELHVYHTNHAECVHRIIKDWTRRQRYNFGASAQDLKRNISPQCVKFRDVHNEPERAWQNPFRNMLQCIVEHFGKSPIIFEESDSENERTDSKMEVDE